MVGGLKLDEPSQCRMSKAWLKFGRIADGSPDSGVDGSPDSGVDGSCEDIDRGGREGDDRGVIALGGDAEEIGVTKFDGGDPVI